MTIRPSAISLPDLASLVRDVPDFPRPGIVFKDITPLLADPAGLDLCVERLARVAEAWKPELVAGIESRGFIVGAPLARQLGLGFVPVRKRGKLPSATVGIDYALEYGSDRLEVHADAICTSQRVLIADDLLATGGTAAATGHLVEKLGGEVCGYSFIITLEFLAGRDRLRQGVPVESILSY
ncbi:MAG: adenine phosphoribosyltransferase [Aphanocapsa feldmannii 277cV]|uniref:Adenine phosphoribosyltransferase n=1 Tax=Aphanocapsa feldmannii 277cV TaxID=2507553 RepID=A0A524RML5_9CHRO|nr:MAG: adenine phosphoribosyltransferase [Aphanocapsa feldmannii 277cV]